MYRDSVYTLCVYILVQSFCINIDLYSCIVSVSIKFRLVQILCINIDLYSYWVSVSILIYTRTEFLYQYWFILVLSFCINIDLYSYWVSVSILIYTRTETLYWYRVSMHSGSNTYIHTRIADAFAFKYMYVLYTLWRRVIGCPLFIGHVPQKSPIISGSFAQNDLQL